MKKICLEPLIEIMLLYQKLKQLMKKAADLCTDIDDASELLSELESEFGNTNILFK